MTAGRRSARSIILVLTALVASGPGCGGFFSDDPDDAGVSPQILLTIEPDDLGSSVVELFGLPDADLTAVKAAGLTSSEWVDLLRVSVADGPEDATGRLPVIGTYSVTEQAVRFSPRYPFDPGRHYRVVFDPLYLPDTESSSSAAWKSESLIATVQEPFVDLRPSTTITQVYPTADKIPENQLRFYVYFSAPMGFVGGADHVYLLDKEGLAVEDAFLPLEVALWNADRTRYTLLFDPGRVKRGILPNEELGRPLTEGETYTLVIDRTWRDASGLPLANSFSRWFTVGPPDERSLDPATWELASPRAGTHDPLVVSFPRSLDYALLNRALLVSTVGGKLVAGDIDIQANETRWLFTPREPWEHVEHHLTILPVLEDTAGNRVGRAFEVESSESIEDQGLMVPTSLLFHPTPSS
jgi:hypothetical protein